jgi:hypothetical protein
MKTGIHCNECGRDIGKKQAAVYPRVWRYSGDMYCKKHDERPQFKQTKKGQK